MDIKKLNETIGGVETSFYPLTHEKAVIDSNGITIASKIEDLNANTYRKSETYNKTETYTKAEVNELITTPEVDFVTVTATEETTSVEQLLPELGISNTIYRIACWDGERYNSHSYSEYTWNGQRYVFLDNKEYGFDEEPTLESENLVTSGNIAKFYGHCEKYPEFIEAKTDSDDKLLEATRVNGTKVIYTDLEVKGNTFTTIENPEWIRVIVDTEDRILCGIRTNGDFYFGAGCPKLIKSYIEEKFLELSLDEYDDIVAFLDGFIGSDTTLQMLLDTKVDKEDGKQLIDTPIAESLSIIDDPESRLEISTDPENKIVSYRDKNGLLHEEAGIETNHLGLSKEGMTEFQQALKKSGFQPGGSGDYTDSKSMCISEPRLAHLNIVSDVNLEELSKEGMPGAVEGINYNVPVQVEFTDEKGNYFKKYALLSGQGRSSLNYVKKGLGFDFFNEDPSGETFNEDNTFLMRFGDWVYQDSFHVKSFYTDFPRCTTPVGYKFANEVLLTRGLIADRTYKKYYVSDYTDSADGTHEPSDLSHNIETGARCLPDGFPVIVYQNGEFWGVNSWQLKKHRDNYQLNKKKDNNVHLDGDFSKGAYVGQDHPQFWLWNGIIDWAVYCDDTVGIETRNPKNLYCIDGKKYNADTHNMEIIDTATAEAWITAGQIIPTGKVIDDELAGYLRTTGKVRKNIEDLTTYIPYINGLADGSILIDGQQATTEQIKTAIEERFDVNSFIDYIIVNNVIENKDAWDNNGQIITWGKLGNSNILNWSVNFYDLDYSFGSRFDGRYATAANNTQWGNQVSNNVPTYPLYKIFWNYYYDDLKLRYKELRDAKIIDADHITQLFRDWMNRVGYDFYKKEYTKWPESPCFHYNGTNGYYGSIYRIYLWIKKRIEYMDDASFFDYNNN